MDKNAKKTMNKKLFVPFIIALIGVLVVVGGLFLPYITATGDMAELLENYPENSIVIEEYNMTANDVKDVPMISIGKIASSAYTEEEQILFNVILLLFSFFLVLTALFIILKKPIPAIIFTLISCGVFICHRLATKYDFIDADKYAWGISYYITFVAFAVILIAAIWMLVKKIIVKKELKADTICQTEQ